MMIWSKSLGASLKLTKKRSKYVEQRSSGVLVGDPLHYPAAASDLYQRELDRLVSYMVREYRKELEATWKSVAMDASIASQSRIALSKLQKRFAKIFSSNASRITDRVLGRVDRSAKSSLKNSLKKISGGVTIPVADMPAGLADAMKAATAENVALIKSIPQQFHLQIEGAVMRSIQTGGRGLQDVTEAVSKYDGITKRRVRIIATDQVRKATTAMNSERAKSAGITKFRWRHSSGSAEPRRLHLRLDNQVFSYDDPPVIDERTGERGLPGQLINCRCFMQPVLDWGDDDE